MPTSSGGWVAIPERPLTWHTLGKERPAGGCSRSTQQFHIHADRCSISAPGASEPSKQVLKGLLGPILVRQLPMTLESPVTASPRPTFMGCFP